MCTPLRALSKDPCMLICQIEFMNIQQELTSQGAQLYHGTLSLMC